MLSNGFDAPLHLRLKPSRQLLYFQITIVALAFIAVLIPTSLLFSVRLGLAILLLINLLILFVIFKRQSLTAMQLNWFRQSGWEEMTLYRTTGSMDKRLWPSQRCMINKSWFILFRLIDDNKQKQVLVFKDQCEDVNDFRRLRVLLSCLSGADAIEQ